MSKRRVLIVVDMQNDFVTGEGGKNQQKESRFSRASI